MDWIIWLVVIVVIVAIVWWLLKRNSSRPAASRIRRGTGTAATDDSAPPQLHDAGRDPSSPRRPVRRRFRSFSIGSRPGLDAHVGGF